MENYELASLKMSQNEENWTLSFERAKLMVIHEYGTLSWYIDIDGISDEELLNRFARSEEIAVAVRTVTIGGKNLNGDGYFHPNPAHRAAAIRGIGELEGYASSPSR
ncbi:hypothetical protein J19TS2_35010 [Cohnella xylanilytica]|uniref:Uncharacterized protein n=1 Tax=Cohnella xylanilytica TaxID=557555 RepID=A0A841U542_9BACL|nr:hypothetical protein [Cohnella xylanilytica]MBB6694702.1 hypothetical protein [Cohnella xylanilytica]GIO13946.1 hypothetical protein J19TS2_35010 [Cohnella xylanilytica]